MAAAKSHIPRPLIVIRRCLRCHKSFPSRGDRVCVACNKANAALPRREAGQHKEPDCGSLELE